MSRSDPITERSVNGLFYQLTDILYNSHNTRVYIGHVIDVPKNKYAIKRPIPLGRKLQVMKEAGSLSKIMHPNVARYIDHSEHHIEPYIVMEFVSDNFERLISSNRITEDIILHYIEQLPSFLRLFNMFGIAHCDIEAKNIGIDRGLIKILDLGGAVPCQFPTTHDSPNYAAITLAPENQNKRVVTPTTDTYCAGRVFESLLLGEYFFEEGLIRVLKETYPLLPDSFFTLYKQMTMDDPLERPQHGNLQSLVNNVVKDMKGLDFLRSEKLRNAK